MPEQTRLELEQEIKDLKQRAEELDSRAIDARHYLAHHAGLGERKDAITYALARLEGGPHEPCACVGAKTKSACVVNQETGQLESECDAFEPNMKVVDHDACSFRCRGCGVRFLGGGLCTAITGDCKVKGCDNSDPITDEERANDARMVAVENRSL